MTHLRRWAVLSGMFVLACGAAPLNGGQSSSPLGASEQGSLFGAQDASVFQLQDVSLHADAGARRGPGNVYDSKHDLLSAPAAAFVQERVWHEGAAMGTHLGFAGYTDASHDAGALHGAFDAAIAEFKRLEALMTTWNATSEISRLNEDRVVAIGKMSPCASPRAKFSPEVLEVLVAAQEASRASAGAFDVTFETLHGLWKFDEDLDPHPPKSSAVRARLPWVGFERLHLAPSDHCAYLVGSQTKVGLGGIAKGYAVDKAATIIRQAGIKSFFVQAGGDLYAEGKKPDGSVWSAGIRDPRGPAGKPFASIELDGHAFSTAGDYERSYVIGKKRYHHILDPRTGMPADKSRSVTVWATSAFQADAVDDAVFVMGPEKGLKYVESLPGVGAVIVDAKNRLWVSERLKGKVTLLAAPTDGV